MGPDSFRLQGSSSNFASKLDSVFGGLGALEKQHDDWAKTNEKGQPPLQKEEPVTLRDSEFSIPRSKTALDRRGQRSLAQRCQERNRTNAGRSTGQNAGGDGFRRPRGLPPPRRPLKVPDHRVHPERWTKYSLDSVSDKDLSDRGNTAAAMTFLREQSAHERESEERADLSKPDRPQTSLVNFRRRGAAIGAKEGPGADQGSGFGKATASSTSSGSCHVMPEHVVGETKSLKATKKRAVRGLKAGTADRVQLSYLEQQDEAEEGQGADHDEGRQASSDRTPVSGQMEVDETAGDEADQETAGERTTLGSEAVGESHLMKRRKFRGNKRARTEEAIQEED